MSLVSSLTQLFALSSRRLCGKPEHVQIWSNGRLLLWLGWWQFNTFAPQLSPASRSTPLPRKTALRFNLHKIKNESKSNVMEAVHTMSWSKGPDNELPDFICQDNDEPSKVRSGQQNSIIYICIYNCYLPVAAQMWHPVGSYLLDQRSCHQVIGSGEQCTWPRDQLQLAQRSCPKDIP